MDFDQYDEAYVSRLRVLLRLLHENLSQGKIAANADTTAEDVHWNFDGNLFISRQELGKALTSVVEGSFKDLYIPDYYQSLMAISVLSCTIFKPIRQVHFLGSQ